MKNPLAMALALLGLAGCTIAPGRGVPATVTRAKDLPPLTLEQANQRWAGASVRTRIPLGFNKGPDDNGFYWSGAGGLNVVDANGKPSFNVYPKVDNRGALRLVDGDLAAGAALVVEGWRLQKPKDNEGAYLVLRFRDQPATMRVEFKTKSAFGTSGFPMNRLSEVEQFIRLNVFEVTTADEQLTAAAAGPPPRAAPSPSEAAAAVFNPSLKILAVSVQPATVPRGSQPELVVHYEVAGLPAGAFEVRETRELWQGERRLLRAEASFPREGGRAYTSTQRATVPAAAAPGLYELRVQVTLAGVTADGKALFEVR
jgi:hypothetical protein